MIIENNFIKEPKVSIIITYYNLGEYINDCISSILEQSYKNFEIIIVNDCSDKINSEILSEIQNEKIKIINLEENKGQLLAFMEGLKYAQGEFICMVDADDILLPNYLKTLLYVHLNNNVALVSSNYGQINQNNEITSLVSSLFKNKDKKIPYKEIERLLQTKDDFELKYLDLNSSPFALWSWNPSTSGMFRKTALKILDYFPDKYFWKTGADKVVFSLLHLVGSSITCSAICYLYRSHKTNVSQTTLTTGDKKYLNEEYVNRLINWNKKIRFDTVKMFILHKKELVYIFNKLNYFKMFCRVIFCINKKICAKVLKTFAHKILNFLY